MAICYGRWVGLMRRTRTATAQSVLARGCLVCAALLASGPACRAGEEAEVYRVELHAIDAHGGPELSEERVRAIVRRSLGLAPSFEVAERDLRSGRGRGELLVASLDYRELPDAVDHGRDLLVRLSVAAPDELEAKIGEDGLDVTILLERDAGDVELSEDLQLAADRLALIIQARVDLARARPDVVQALLQSRDPELLVMTLEWIRDHPEDPQARSAAGRLAELITHDDERVGLLAIEAMGLVGGPEHVQALLTRVQLWDASQMTRTYDAVARMGGPDAQGFLEFAARNEDEPEGRAAALRALRRVEGEEPTSFEKRNRGHR